jgi:hypothetical protein
MSPIKPPDGKVPGAASPPSGSAPTSPNVEQRAGVAFDDALAAAERARTAASQSAGPSAVQQSAASAQAQSIARAGGADPIAELAHAVRTGALSPEQALERLVDRIADNTGKHLSVAQRAELGVLLRSALQTDPALIALRDAFE